VNETKQDGVLFLTQSPRSHAPWPEKGQGGYAREGSSVEGVDRPATPIGVEYKKEKGRGGSREAEGGRLLRGGGFHSS